MDKLKSKLFYSLLLNIYPENKAAEKEGLNYSVATLAVGSLQ